MSKNIFFDTIELELFLVNSFTAHLVGVTWTNENDFLEILCMESKNLGRQLCLGFRASGKNEGEKSFIS